MQLDGQGKDASTPGVDDTDARDAGDQYVGVGLPRADASLPAAMRQSLAPESVLWGWSQPGSADAFRAPSLDWLQQERPAETQYGNLQDDDEDEYEEVTEAIGGEPQGRETLQSPTDAAEAAPSLAPKVLPTAPRVSTVGMRMGMGIQGWLHRLRDEVVRLPLHRRKMARQAAYMVLELPPFGKKAIRRRMLQEAEGWLRPVLAAASSMAAAVSGVRRRKRKAAALSRAASRTAGAGGLESNGSGKSMDDGDGEDESEGEDEAGDEEGSGKEDDEDDDDSQSEEEEEEEGEVGEGGSLGQHLTVGPTAGHSGLGAIGGVMMGSPSETGLGSSSLARAFQRPGAGQRPGAPAA